MTKDLYIFKLVFSHCDIQRGGDGELQVPRLASRVFLSLIARYAPRIPPSFSFLRIITRAVRSSPLRRSYHHWSDHFFSDSFGSHHAKLDLGKDGVAQGRLEPFSSAKA